MIHFAELEGIQESRYNAGQAEHKTTRMHDLLRHSISGKISMAVNWGQPDE
jgi:hypothetical protein